MDADHRGWGHRLPVSLLRHRCPWRRLVERCSRRSAGQHAAGAADRKSDHDDADGAVAARSAADLAVFFAAGECAGRLSQLWTARLGNRAARGPGRAAVGRASAGSAAAAAGWGAVRDRGVRRWRGRFSAGADLWWRTVPGDRLAGCDSSESADTTCERRAGDTAEWLAAVAA